MKRVMVIFVASYLLVMFSAIASAEKCQYAIEKDASNASIEFVEGSVIIPLYTDIDAISAVLSIVGNTAYCNGSIQTSTGGATTSVSVRLQRSNNGTSWTTIKTWSGSGTYIADVTGQYTISPGYQYRVYVYGSILNQSGSVIESATKYSTVKIY